MDFSRIIEKERWERKSHNTLIYSLGDETITFKRRSKNEKLKTKLVNMTCSKIDNGPRNLLRLVILKNMLRRLDERLATYPDSLYLQLTGQKHPYKHLLVR